MAWWKDLIFGTPKTVETAARVGETIVNGVVNGIDKIWYTDEEKAEAKQKATETLLKFWDHTANENSEQSKARRDLAIMVMKSYFAMLFMAIATYGFGLYQYAKFILEIVGSITFLVTMVAGIYFGPHQISKIWTKNGKENGQ